MAQHRDDLEELRRLGLAIDLDTDVAERMHPGRYIVRLSAPPPRPEASHAFRQTFRGLADHEFRGTRARMQSVRELAGLPPAGACAAATEQLLAWPYTRASAELSFKLQLARRGMEAYEAAQAAGRRAVEGLAGAGAAVRAAAAEDPDLLDTFQSLVEFSKVSSLGCPAPSWCSLCGEDVRPGEKGADRYHNYGLVHRACLKFCCGPAKPLRPIWGDAAGRVTSAAQQLPSCWLCRGAFTTGRTSPVQCSGADCSHVMHYSCFRWMCSGRAGDDALASCIPRAGAAYCPPCTARQAHWDEPLDSVPRGFLERGAVLFQGPYFERCGGDPERYCGAVFLEAGRPAPPPGTPTVRRIRALELAPEEAVPRALQGPEVETLRRGILPGPPAAASAFTVADLPRRLRCDIAALQRLGSVIIRDQVRRDARVRSLLGPELQRRLEGPPVAYVTVEQLLLRDRDRSPEDVRATYHPELLAKKVVDVPGWHWICGSFMAQDQAALVLRDARIYQQLRLEGRAPSPIFVPPAQADLLSKQMEAVTGKGSHRVDTLIRRMEESALSVLALNFTDDFLLRKAPLAKGGLKQRLLQGMRAALEAKDGLLLVVDLPVFRTSPLVEEYECATELGDPAPLAGHTGVRVRPGAERGMHEMEIAAVYQCT